MVEKEMRNFALRDKDGNEIGVFTGKAPRQAALKAANRGNTDIRLRERGTKKVHIFTGKRKQVKAPKGAPASSQSCSNAMAHCGTHPACFTITTLPAIKLGAAKRASW